MCRVCERAKAELEEMRARYAELEREDRRLPRGLGVLERRKMHDLRYAIRRAEKEAVRVQQWQHHHDYVFPSRRRRKRKEVEGQLPLGLEHTDDTWHKDES